MTKVKLAAGLVLLRGLLGSSTPNITDPGVVMLSEVNIPAEGESGNWGLAGGTKYQYPAMAIDGIVYS